MYTLKKKPTKELTPKYGYNNDVHWFFRCGCEYKGPEFRVGGVKICIHHGAKLKKEILTCFNIKCGKKFENPAGGRSKGYCPECIKERKRQQTSKWGNSMEDGKLRCATKGCNELIKIPKRGRPRLFCVKCRREYERKMNKSPKIKYAKIIKQCSFPGCTDNVDWQRGNRMLCAYHFLNASNFSGMYGE